MPGLFDSSFASPRKNTQSTSPLTSAEASTGEMAGIFGSNTSASSTASNLTAGDLKNDVIINNPPEDSISALRFSPKADYLAVSSWDKKVRIYEINSQTGQGEGKALFEHEGPVLNCCWSKDGTKVFGAGADKAARMLDLNGNISQASQVAAHDQPIRSVQAFEAGGTPMLVTGGWDKMIKYWDLRQQQPAAQLECKDRIYSMDIRGDNMLVAATAERWIHVVNLANPATFFKTMQSPLKWQTRVASTFTDGTGFALGSIEGRCAIQYVDEKDSSNNFSFKCHRGSPPNATGSGTNTSISNVYAVNAISFHPIHGTFSTAGSDGTFHFWDKDAKHRLKGYPEVGGTISATDFNHNGNIFAYAVSYDWSKGYSFNTPQYPNKIMLHPIVGDECSKYRKK